MLASLINLDGKLVFAIIVGLTRLYLGVHYPADVLFAVFEGIVIGYVSEVIVNGVIKIVKTSTKSYFFLL